MPFGESFPYYSQYLGNDELAIELEIRDIPGKSQQSITLLDNIMLAEFEGRATRPSKMHTIESPTTEIRECSQNVKLLIRYISDIVRTPEWKSAEILRSRMMHIGYRILRIPQSFPPNLEIDQLAREAEFLMNEERKLREFLSKNVGPPPNPVITSAVGRQSNKKRADNTQQPPRQKTPMSDRASVGQNQSAPVIPHIETGDIATTNFSAEQFSMPPPQIPIQVQATSIGNSIASQCEIESLQLETNNPDSIFTQPRNSQPFQQRIGQLPQAAPRSVFGDHINMQQPNQQGAGCIVGKWSIRFSGNSNDMPADDFLFRVEDMAESSSVHFDNLVGAFHYLLSGRAEEWFWSYRRKQRRTNWIQFRDSFTRKFATRQTDAEVLSLMSQRIQKPGERFDDFCRAIESL